MDRQAAYDLFKCFLEKRGLKGTDLRKELPGLLAYGVAKGCFADPNQVFEEAEWRRFRDKMWEAVLDDCKMAKKLSKAWRAIKNALKQYQAEQRAAQVASARLGIPVSSRSGEGATLSGASYPLPLATNTVFLPAGSNSAAAALPAAPLLEPASPAASPCSAAAPVSPAGPPVPQLANSPAAVRIANERRKAWREIAGDAIAAGDRTAADTFLEIACPVVYAPNPAGGLQATITTLDWKWLAQLRAAVTECGIHGEPTRQMLDYLWSGHILLPSDIKGLLKLVLTQHPQLLFNAHWQAACQESVAMQRQTGDPLHGITLDELMGIGAYLRTEAQALLGPDKLREAMRLARVRLDRVKSPGGIPSYMGIKQGRDEPFGLFIDRVASAIQTAGDPEYMHGALLKQCALQNCNSTTRGILVTLPGTWTIEEALERMAQIPVGPQGMLVEAVKDLGSSLKEQAQAAQSQVLAALAPLQASATRCSGRGSAHVRCFRCNAVGHRQKNCPAGAVWCHHCRSDPHSDSSCMRDGLGNVWRSAKRNGSRAQTQIVSPKSDILVTQTAQPSTQPPAAVSDWTWRPQ
ncbi:GAK6 protein, partial [Nesospiza acunhae]|nr:GAK6 protein [Nesospiza acunhae]